MTTFRAILVLALLAAPVLAADWPQWLGPKRDGSSTEKVAPWKGDLKVLWRKAVGPGHGSPVVAGGKVYLHAQVKGKEEEALTAYDAVKGNVLWTKSYTRQKFSSPYGTGPQATPAVADGRVFTYGATGVLTCYDAKTGKPLWQVDAEKTFEAPRLYFGAASSPLIDGDNVLVQVGGKKGAVVAFKQKDGEVAFKALQDKASYATGIVRGEKKDRQLIFFTQKGLRGLTPDKGELLWEFGLQDKLNESSSTPVMATADILLASSITTGMVGIKLSKDDDGKWTAKQAWKNGSLSCYFSTPMMIDKKHAYIVTGTIFRPQATLHCVDVEKGEIKWSKKSVGKFHAALLKTGDGKLLMLSDFGDLLLLEPNVKEYKELAKSKVTDAKGGLWAHPALSDGRVYIRDEKELICVAIGGTGEP